MKKNTNGDSGTYVSITKDLTFVPLVSKSPREEENTCRVKKKNEEMGKKSLKFGNRQTYRSKLQSIQWTQRIQHKDIP